MESENAKQSFKVKKHVEVWKEDFEWFEKTHVGASLSWFTANALHAYRTVCENPAEHIKDLADLSPVSTIGEGMKLLKEEVDDGVHKE